MVRSLRRRIVFVVLATLAIALVFHSLGESTPEVTTSLTGRLAYNDLLRAKFKWKDVPQRHPVENLTALPIGPVAAIPRIQADFEPESHEERVERHARLAAVKGALLHSWEGYKRNSWLQDEVAPLSGESKNGFGGWGATLVDSLDTLWIMGLKEEFAIAVSELRKIDFTANPLDTLNVFETTIRYMGGFLSAYDVSGHTSEILLDKAIELGDMLYVAFDTPNRMPITRWDWKNGALGGGQEADSHALLAEVGSMTVEFTRLSQLTGDPKWYDAIARIVDVLHGWQNHTKIPGLWPVRLNARHLDFSKDITFTFGVYADSLYEYLPKQHLMLGGRVDQYREMYLTALETAKAQLFFQPLNPNNDKILLSGTRQRRSAGSVKLLPQGQHLSCFAGGMVALAAKIFQQAHDLDTARQLVDGCLWAYESMPTGIMPEIFTAMPCVGDTHNNCTWSSEEWYEAVQAHVNPDAETRQLPIKSAQKVIKEDRLPPGMLEINDSRYNLRPEAIESLFVLYRVTGDKTLQEKAWSMFQTIDNVTKTEIVYASVSDVRDKQAVLEDSMESYWTGETLKYFYLIFSEPDVISLDEYILNTEAHPLLRPK